MKPRWIAWLLWLNELQRRLLITAFALLGPRWAYDLTAAGAHLMYRLLLPLRWRCETQCRAALRRHTSPARCDRIAARSWTQRVWNLTDLLLADRRLQPGHCTRTGLTLPAAARDDLRAAQARRQPAILLTAYYGPYDLLPAALGFDGLPVTALYRPHANPWFDRYRRRIRARGHTTLVPVDQALHALPAALEAGRTVALVADHHRGRRSLPVTFLGLPTTALPTVGLLATRYSADVVVAGIRRQPRRAFRFEIDVLDVIKARDYAADDDAVAAITHRYLRALERLILQDPTQYLWAYARWGKAHAAAAQAPPR